MGINLQKGQRVDLTKGNAGLNRIKVGLGWDPVGQEKAVASLAVYFLVEIVVAVAAKILTVTPLY